MTTLLGVSGMLGSMLADTWDGDFDALGRPEYDALDPYWGRDLKLPVVNCIGLIKPYCTDVEAAIRVNALFPHTLPKGTIQIATDCVYSGKKGNYVETDPHDALDVYGKTKSLGEAPHIKNLRCSIIGPEIKGKTSLLEWFLQQKTANGFTNHYWNGITTLAFSRICQGIIREGIELPNVQHVVPADKVTKARLLRIISNAYAREIPVYDLDADEACDRTLSTLNPELNELIWKAAGYEKIPTIQELVEEMASL